MSKELDLIWIKDASKEFARSQVWLYDQIKKGTLARFEIPGDNKTYLDRNELKKLLQPRRTSPKSEE